MKGQACFKQENVVVDTAPVSQLLFCFRFIDFFCVCLHIFARAILGGSTTVFRTSVLCVFFIFSTVFLKLITFTSIATNFLRKFGVNEFLLSKVANSSCLVNDFLKFSFHSPRFLRNGLRLVQKIKFTKRVFEYTFPLLCPHGQ